MSARGVGEETMTLRCSACGGTEHLRPYSPWHRTPICNPCFMVWYDAPEQIDNTDPKAVGELSMRLKAAGKFPWDAATLAGLGRKR